MADEISIAALCGRLGRIDYLVVTGDQPHAGAIQDLDIEDAKQGYDNQVLGVDPRGQARRAPHSGGWRDRADFPRARRPAVARMVTLAALNAAMEGLIRGWRWSCRRRVNGISPGRVATPSLDWMSGEQRAARSEAFRDPAPAKRVGMPEDCAEAILMLLINRFATGKVLRLGGGYAIG